MDGPKKETISPEHKKFMTAYANNFKGEATGVNRDIIIAAYRKQFTHSRRSDNGIMSLFYNCKDNSAKVRSNLANISEAVKSDRIPKDIERAVNSMLYGMKRLLEICEAGKKDSEELKRIKDVLNSVGKVNRNGRSVG